MNRRDDVRRLHLTAIVILLAIVLLMGVTRSGVRDAVGAGSAQTAATIRNPVAASAESVAAGKQAYMRVCAPCHGSSAEGGAGNDLIPASPDLTDAAWDHGSSDGEIFTNIKDGIGPDFNMTPFKDRLKDEEIWTIVNYLRSIAKK